MSVAGVVLAAGASRRFAEQTPPGGYDALPRLKQLLPFGGEALVRRATRAALDSRLANVVVVVGCEAEAVRAEISDLPVEIVENPEWDLGQSTSVRAGLRSIDPDSDAAVFLPCDQPFLAADTIDRLLEARSERGTSILTSGFQDRFGPPVLIGRELFGEMAKLEGDAGGRQMFWTHRDSFGTVELEDALGLEDVDSWDDYVSLSARL